MILKRLDAIVHMCGATIRRKLPIEGAWSKKSVVQAMEFLSQKQQKIERIFFKKLEPEIKATVKMCC